MKTHVFGMNGGERVYTHTHTRQQGGVQFYLPWLRGIIDEVKRQLPLSSGETQNEVLPAADGTLLIQIPLQPGRPALHFVARF